jgi:hypothetical protein
VTPVYENEEAHPEGRGRAGHSMDDTAVARLVGDRAHVSRQAGTFGATVGRRTTGRCASVPDSLVVDESRIWWEDAFAPEFVVVHGGWCGDAAREGRMTKPNCGYWGRRFGDGQRRTALRRVEHLGNQRIITLNAAALAAPAGALDCPPLQT